MALSFNLTDKLTVEGTDDNIILTFQEIGLGIKIPCKRDVYQDKVIIRVHNNAFWLTLEVISKKVTKPTIAERINQFLAANQTALQQEFSSNFGGKVKLDKEPVFLTRGKGSLVKDCIASLNYPSNFSDSQALSICLQLSCMVDSTLYKKYFDSRYDLPVHFTTETIWRQMTGVKSTPNQQVTSATLFGPLLYLMSFPAKGNVDENTLISLRKRLSAFFSSAKIPENNDSPMNATIALKIATALNNHPSLIAFNTKHVITFQNQEKVFQQKLYEQCEMVLEYGGLSGFKACVDFLQNDASAVWTIDQVCEEGVRLASAWDEFIKYPAAPFRKMVGEDNPSWHLANYPNIIFCVKERDQQMSKFTVTHTPTVPTKTLLAALSESMDVNLQTGSTTKFQKIIWERKGVRPASHSHGLLSWKLLMSEYTSINLRK